MHETAMYSLMKNGERREGGRVKGRKGGEGGAEIVHVAYGPGV